VIAKKEGKKGLRGSGRIVNPLSANSLFWSTWPIEMAKTQLDKQKGQ